MLKRSDGVVVVVGSNYHGQCNSPSWPPGVLPVSIQAVGDTSTALLSNGTIAIWGSPGWGVNNVPALPPGVTYVSCALGLEHALALRSDGQLVAWGLNQFGECNVPPLPPGVGYIAASPGRDHSVALRSDGTVVAWGGNYVGQLDVPALEPGETVFTISAGANHTVAQTTHRVLQWGHQGFSQIVFGLPARVGGLPVLRHVDAVCPNYNSLLVLSDGTVQAFGDNPFLQNNIPALPKGKRYLRVAGSPYHAMAIRSDGQVVAWGDNSAGQCNVPALPSGMTYTDLAVGSGHSVVLRSDGQALAFGSNTWGQCNIPTLPANVRYVEIDAGDPCTLLRRSDHAVIVVAATGAYWLSSASFPAPPPGKEYRIVKCGRSGAAGLCTDGTLVHLPVTSTSVSFRPLPALPFGVYYVEVDAGESGTSLRSSDGEVEVCGYVDWNADHVPPLDPGTSYVQVRTDSRLVTARVGPTSTYVSFAHGCAGSQQAARLVPMDTPHIGKVQEVNICDLPQNVAFLLFGWSRTAPVSLTALGMPGCSSTVSTDGAYFLAGQNGMASYRLPIPNLPSLVGLHFFNQALVLDPGANPLGAVVSDAAEGVIGHW